MAAQPPCRSRVGPGANMTTSSRDATGEARSDASLWVQPRRRRSRSRQPATMQCGHDGDHAAYRFSISEPETWPVEAETAEERK
jgi:hypothetical protein